MSLLLDCKCLFDCCHLYYLFVCEAQSFSWLKDKLITLGPQNEYKIYNDSFYHGNSLAVDHLLNIVDAEKHGHDKLMKWVNV